MNSDPDWDEAVVVALGSNLAEAPGGSMPLLEAALQRFAGAGLFVKARSSWWRSAAWPDASQPAFLNGVALVETGLEPEAALAALLEIERAFGRERATRNAPRTLDLDLIAYGRMVRTGATLTLPHPRAHERLFVVGPMAEIAPGWRHPALGLTAAALAATATVGRDAAPIGLVPSLRCTAAP